MTDDFDMKGNIADLADRTVDGLLELGTDGCKGRFILTSMGLVASVQVLEKTALLKGLIGDLNKANDAKKTETLVDIVKASAVEIGVYVLLTTFDRRRAAEGIDTKGDRS